MARIASGAAPSAAQRSILSRIVDRVWWFFTSVRVALWLIGITVVWVLVATLAQSTFPSKVAEWVPGLSSLMEKWTNWEVWNSLPFLGTLGLLAISLILGGMVCRWSGIAQRVWHPNVRTSEGFFKAIKNSETFPVTRAEDGVNAFTGILGSKRYRVVSWTNEKTGATHLYADKNRFSPLATFPFHTGLVLVMLGGVMMASFGWREFGFLVPDGGVRPVGHETGLSVRNKGFVDEYYDDGRAKDYYTDVDILKGGTVVESGRLRVNDPVSYGGISLHQATFGQAAKITISDATGNLLWEDSVPVAVPANRALAAQFTDASGEQRSVGSQRLEDLGIILRVVGSGGPQDENIGVGQMAIAVFDNRATKAGAGPIGTATLDPGAAATIGGLRFTFQREVRFTGLQITYAPWLWLVILASSLIFFSLLVTFYLPHRRIRALVVPQPDGTGVMRLGAQVKLDIFGAQEFEKIAKAVQAGLTTDDATPRIRSDASAQTPAPMMGD